MCNCCTPIARAANYDFFPKQRERGQVREPIGSDMMMMMCAKLWMDRRIERCCTVSCAVAHIDSATK